MPLRDLTGSSRTLLDSLISHHSPYLDSINPDQLLTFIDMIKNKDFNKLGDSQLSKVKEDMEKDFVNNQVSMNDPEFKYDVRVI